MTERLRAATRWLWRRRRTGLRSLPVVLPVLLVLGVMVRYDDTFHLPDHEVPEGFVPAPVPTTLPAGSERPTLPLADGTTTSLPPPNVGRAHLAGYVVGPDGAGVPGAQVRVERAIGGGFQVADVFADGTGRYDVSGIGGGRYRVRAFLAPTFAQAHAEVFFLRDAEDRTLDLTVGAYGEPSIALAIAPNPPLLDQPLSLAVRVTGRFVDPDGFVRVQPLVGGLVDVVLLGSWERDTTPGSVFTDLDGQADLLYTCRGLGAAQAQVSVRATADAVPVVENVDLPPCLDPATLTTTTLEAPSTSQGETTTSTTETGATTTVPPPTTVG